MSTSFQDRLGALKERLLKPPGIYVAIGAVAILAAYFLFYFTLGTGGREAVEVTDFSPADEVQPATNFTIEFSRALVPDSLVNRRMDNGPVTFTPAIPGKFQWLTSNRLRFYPEAVLAPSTEYVADISSELAAASGYALAGESRFTIRTPRVRVNSAALNFEFIPEQGEAANLVASVEFNYQVDPDEAAKFIAVFYEGGDKVPFKLTTTAPSNIIALVAEEVARGEEDKNIRLQVAAGLRCVGGELPLERDFEQPVIVPRQQDLIVDRANARLHSPNNGVIRVQFNIPVQLTSAQEFIAVEPAIKFNFSASHYYLELQGSFDAGKTYTLTIKPGLRAIDGSELKREFSTALTFQREAIPPQIDFVGSGFYLTRSGGRNLGVSTINLNKISLEVEKVYANNLVYLLNSTNPAGNNQSGYYEDEYEYYGYSGYNLRALGKKVAESDFVVQSVPHEEVVTPVNLSDYLAGERNGIFKITAMDADNRWRNATKWVMATDMGLLAKKAGDDLWVWVNSLATLAPVANAELTLISQNNQTLMSGRSNEVGVAIFKSYTKFIDEFTPYLITAKLGDDLTFLELQRRRIPTSDFDVEGLPYLTQGYEVFLYTERGVYRPGETAKLAGIVRGENAAVPAPFPVRLQVKGPDDRVLDEQRATLNEQGAVAFAVEVPDYVLTGKYTARLLIGKDQEIGRTAFNVEDFIPDRMKVNLNTDKESYAAGEVMNITVEGIMLFGPPAAGRRVQSDLEISAVPFSTPKYRSFTFADYKKEFAQQKFELASAVLDENGRHTYKFEIPKNFDPPSALRGMIATTVLEPGGRGVSAYRSFTIHPFDTYVGLRRQQEGYAAPGQPVRFECVVVNPAGEPVAQRGLEVVLYRTVWHSILKKMDDGRFRYVSERVDELQEKFMAVSQAGTTELTVTPRDYGSYRVVARDTQSNMSSSLSFYASGWGYAPWAMDNPDRVELDLDKARYLPGETAKLQVRAPFTGKLLLTIEREKIFDYQVVDLPANTATIDLPINATYRPNVYVAAHLIRSTAGLERDLPARGFGVIPLMIDNEANRLGVALTAPETIRPNTKLTVDYKITGHAGNAPYLTIAAVDEGICQLTEFQTPDPHAYFYGKKRLATESFDIYGLLLPEVFTSQRSAAGDASRQRRLSPVSVKRVKPLAFWSGLVKANRDGSGRVSFDLPQFNGSVRLMAVAFAGNKFGASQKNVIVREPIVLTPTLPRFISSTDAFVVPVSVFNGTGKDDPITVELDIDGPVALSGDRRQSLQVAPNTEGQVQFQCKAENAIGKVTFRFAAQGGGERASMEEDVPLRPPVPYITIAGSGSIKQDQPVSFTLPGEFLPGTTDYTVTVSAFPALNFAGGLDYLLSYPHGCIEQTTSKVFPLLYFNELAREVQPELFARNSADYFIEEGIAKLESMQLGSGVFSFWPQGNYVNNWGSVYASHFMVEARKAGYAVADRVYERTLTALRSYQRDFRENDPHSFETAVYAAYVLALADKPDKSTIHYLKNNWRDRLSLFSQYQLAGAFAFSGDLATARTLMPSAAPPAAKSATRESGGNFNSPIRAQAIMLAVLAEIDPGNAAVPELVKRLSAAADKQRRWGNTQENAFALMALGKILKQQIKAEYTGTITVAGSKHGDFVDKDQSFSSKEWGGKEIKLAIKGAGTSYYYWRADGIPVSLHVAETDQDLRVRRRYLDKQGNALNYATLQQGEMIIAEITVDALTESMDNVAIVDMLPAGLEIENPRLQSRAGIDWIGKSNYSPQFLDIRDDRLVLYGNFQHNRQAKFYYGLSVVTRGTFILPPIRAEAMYAPSKASVASSGQVIVQ